MGATEASRTAGVREVGWAGPSEAVPAAGRSEGEEEEEKEREVAEEEELEGRMVERAWGGRKARKGVDFCCS